MAVVKGGKNFYGFRIGVLMLESSFPRIAGDIGNASSFDFPVLYKVVRGASPKKVVTELKDEDLEIFITAARELEAEGVSAITTTCGFLAIFQEKIRQTLHIPFFASSLMMIPMIDRMLPSGKCVGVMTVNSESLTPEHLKGAGAGEIPVVIYGLQGEEEFSSHILGNQTTLDVEKCRREHRKVAKRMVEEHPEVGAIVLECTNMPPYAADIQEVTGRPVFDICSLMRLMQSALAGTGF